jgi:hypothetical protein
MRAGATLLLLPLLGAAPGPSAPLANMNGLYTISNPHSAAGVEWDSNYNTFKDVEYFEVDP